MGKVICFDVDGVLASFSEGFNAVAKRLTGVDLLYPWPTWDSYGGLTKPEIDACWADIKSDPWFWCGLLPMKDPDTFYRITRLGAWATIYYVTHRMGIAPQAQTHYWLEKHGVYKPSVIVSKFKGEVAKAVGAAHFLEDKAENAWAAAWLSPGTQSYLLDRPYNQYDANQIGSSKVKLVFSVEEFLEEVERGD